MFGYVYITRNNINNKIYIGKREKSYFDAGYIGSGKYLKHAIDKYGKDNFSCEILEWCEDRDSLYDKEIYYIDLYNSRDASIGYNIAKGGQGGSFPHSEEWKIKHSGSGNGRFGKEVSKETRDKIGKANSGKVRSLETKLKISNSLKGKKKPDGFVDKISKIHSGKKLSDDTKQKLREFNLGKTSLYRGSKLYNDGVTERLFRPNDIIPDGFKPGSIRSGMHSVSKNNHWYNNGKSEILAETCPNGYQPGRLKRSKTKRSIST